jgi:DUF1365 family protein
MESALYIGTLRHRRFSPRAHEFTYPLFMPFLDIDRIPELMLASRLTGHNRFRWASFWDEDHFGDRRSSLRERLARDAESHGVALPPGKVFLLTHLRYLGYNFNPVSFFYCYDEAGTLRAIMAEVNNTFGETHNYWLASGNDASRNGNAQHFTFDKAFHVSPFMEMDCRYRWTFTDPGEGLVVQTNNYRNGTELFDATLKLERHDWNPAEIRRALTRFPLVTAKVIAGIHWHAIRLWMKRVPVVRHPGAGVFQAVNKKHLGAAWSPGAPRDTGTKAIETRA